MSLCRRLGRCNYRQRQILLQLSRHVFGRYTRTEGACYCISRNHGHTVMTGDGVNDILALEAVGLLYLCCFGFCRSQETLQRLFRQIMTLRTRQKVAVSMSSITFRRSAALILVKTVHTAALALYCIIAPPYPFIPKFKCRCLQPLTAIVCVMLEPNHDLGAKGNFLVNILQVTSSSIAVIITLSCAPAPQVAFLGSQFLVPGIYGRRLSPPQQSWFALLRRIPAATKPRIALLSYALPLLLADVRWRRDLFRIATTPRILPYLALVW